MQRGLGRASACCGMKIQSAKCQSYQKFARAAYDEEGVSKLHQLVEEKNQTEFIGLVPQVL